MIMVELQPKIVKFLQILWFSSSGTFSFDSLVTNYRNRNETSVYGKEVTPEDGCVIHFTSGTTGRY